MLLTTNLEGNMDTAFRRRVQFVVRFPKPGPAERSAIWRRTLPVEAPVDAGGDFDLLGEDFELVALVSSSWCLVSRLASDGQGLAPVSCFRPA